MESLKLCWQTHIRWGVPRDRSVSGLSGQSYMKSNMRCMMGFIPISNEIDCVTQFAAGPFRACPFVEMKEELVGVCNSLH